MLKIVKKRKEKEKEKELEREKKEERFLDLLKHGVIISCIDALDDITYSHIKED